MLPLNFITMATWEGPLKVLVVGGDVALDFANTVGGLRDAPPDPDNDALSGYDDLLVWCVRLGVLTEREASSLKRAARTRPSEAERAFRSALELRQLVYDLFRPFAEGRGPAPEDLARLAGREGQALAHGFLAPDGWTWHPADELSAPLWRLAHGAVELLTRGPLERLKVCANCRWLFLDESRNRSRRWCSMEDCGEAIKKQRYVERRRALRG